MKKIFFFISLIFIAHNVNAQGCSDAGFCTMGALQPQQFNDSNYYKNSFKFTTSYGLGEQRTIIYQETPEVELSFFKNNLLQLKIPFLFISGNLGKNNGIGDISFSITQTIKKTNKTKWDVSIGTKIAVNNSNAEENNLPLPMVYQTSLGTDDIIVGTALHYKKWNFSTGFQGIISNNNKNNFLHSAWINNADAQKYFESNLLERTSDALLRIEREFIIRKINLSAGLLGIYHLNESSLVNGLGERVAIENSDGLTLNITGNVQYNFSKRTGLNISFGFPVVTPKARPDGLTRDLVLAARFNYNF